MRNYRLMTSVCNTPSPLALPPGFIADLDFSSGSLSAWGETISSSWLAAVHPHLRLNKPLPPCTVTLRFHCALQ
jgi:hypothetical protein